MHQADCKAHLQRYKIGPNLCLPWSFATRALLVQNPCLRKTACSNSLLPLPHSTWLGPTGFLTHILPPVGAAPQGIPLIREEFIIPTSPAIYPGILGTETFCRPFSDQTVVNHLLFFPSSTPLIKSLSALLVPLREDQQKPTLNPALQILYSQ